MLQILHNIYKNKLYIVFGFITGILLTVLISNLVPNLNLYTEKELTDKATARLINATLKEYLDTANDWNLTFGEKSNDLIDVEKIISKLQQPIVVNGKKFDYTLKGGLELYNPVWRKNKGWEITIKKVSHEVNVVPSKEGNCLKILTN